MALNPFKKHLPPLGVEGKVSGADRKKLRRAMEKAFPLLTEQDLEAVLPAKAGELVSTKLAAPRRETIYRLDGEPILIDTSNKLDLQPTIFALWRAPTMLPCVYVKHPAVTQYLVSGADLMLPGVHIPPEGLPPFNKDDLVAAGMSSRDALTRKGGKLVEVLQAYGDCLWETLGQRKVPNDGFLPHAVVPVGLGSAGLDSSGYQEDENGQPLQPSDTIDGDAAVTATTAAVGDLTLTNDQGTTTQGTTTPADGATGASNGVGGQGQGHGEGASTSGASGGFPPTDMDQLLEITLLQALRRTVKDDSLPITSSVLWAQHMQPCRPQGTSLDVKKSRHKKLSAFLKAYGGKGGLLGLKEDKHSGDQVVTSVNRQHELYQHFRPYRLDQMASGAAGVSDASDGASGAAGGGGGAGDASGNTLVIDELWRAGKELRPILEALGIHSDTLFTASEAGEVAFAYVQHAELTKNAPDDKTIVLDPYLCDALFKGVIKKGDMYPSHIPKADLRELFLRRCQHQTRITRGHESVVKKGTAPSVQVSVEKRQGNKRVTRVVGVETFLVSPDVLATECQKKFAASCTATELPGKNQGHEVVVQGNVIEHMASFLQTRFGIPKKYISEKN